MTRETRSAKEERFCIEVVRPGNSLSDAYRIAFQPKNCSAKTINEQASRLRKTSKVDARIAALMAPIVASVLHHFSHQLLPTAMTPLVRKHLSKLNHLAE